MDEQEIVEKVEKRLNPTQYGGMCPLGYSNWFCFGEDDINAIKSLLELYKKEKEKNNGR